MTLQTPPHDPPSPNHSGGDFPGISVVSDAPGPVIQPITMVQPGQVPAMDPSGGVSTTATESYEYCTFAPQRVSLTVLLILASVIPVYYSLFGKWHS